MAYTFTAGALSSVMPSGGVTVAFPASPQVGDIFLAFFAIRSNVGFDTPADWTKELENLGGDTDATSGIGSGQVFSYRYTGSGSSVTFSRTAGDRGQGVIVGVRGAVAAGAPVDVASIQVSSVGAASGLAFPHLTATASGDPRALLTFVSFGDNATGGDFTSSTPAGGSWAEVAMSNDNTGADGGGSVYYHDVGLAASASCSSLAATASAAGGHVTATVLLKPSTSQTLTQAATIASGASLFAGTVAALAMTAALYEGDTVRKTQTIPLTASYATTSIALSTEERDAISDWANLRLRLTADGIQAAVSWAELETPAGDTAQTLTQAATIASGVSQSVPTITVGAVGLVPPTIATGEAINAPALAYAVAGATLASGEALNAPTVAYAVAGASLASGASVQDGHEITVGAVTLADATIAAGSAVQDGHIISQAGGLQYLTGVTIAAGSTLDAGVVTVGAVGLEPPTVTSGEAINAPVLAYAVAAATLASGAVVQDGHDVAGGAVTLTGATLASGASLTAPTIRALTVVLLEGETPRATRTILLGASYTTNEFALTTDERNAIGVWSNVRLSLTADGTQASVSWAELETPAATTTTDLTGATIASGEALYAPVVVGGLLTLEPPAIASGEALYAPTVPANEYVTLALYEGAALRATRVVTPTTALATLSFDLSAEEFASITDWTALEVAVAASVNQTVVTWLALETPDHTVTATPISSGSELFAPTVQAQALTVLLYEGDTLRATLSAGLTSSLTSRELTLTQAQRDSITDWATLRVSLVADTDQARVTWLQVRAPNPEIITATIAATELFAPSLGGVTVTLYQDEHIPSTASLYAPSIVPGNALVGATIASGEALSAPAVAYVVAGATLGSTVTLEGATVTAGAVTLEPPTRASAAVLRAPVVVNAGSLGGEVLDSTETLWAPTVAAGAVALTGATIGSGEALNAPAVAVGAVTLTGAAIPTGAQLFAPSIAGNLTTATITSTAVLRVPIVAPATARLRPPTVGSTAQLYAGTVVPVPDVYPPALPSTAALYGPWVYFAGSAFQPDPARTYCPPREWRRLTPGAELRTYTPPAERRSTQVP